ncbi:uncharacterized protein LOC18783079 [Prunus persica]|uniref:uncharacterized protein LOC18783079 n=1 Tax=Prunus persica TaxID=3760 RepID=UPI0009AB92DF|nr:uncharacterized protein LOC18783079 [Prunus persica]
MSPFQALYGIPPPSIHSYLTCTIAVQAVETALRDCDATLRLLHDNLLLVQNRMKQFHDRKRTECTFEIGDWVYLKLHPYRQHSITPHHIHKLSLRYYGPFQVAAWIGAVAYGLFLPAGSKIHPVFHVPLLHKPIGTTCVSSPTLPPINPFGSLLWTPEAVLGRSIFKFQNTTATKWFIKWQGLPTADATWGVATDIITLFPHFQA